MGEDVLRAPLLPTRRRTLPSARTVSLVAIAVAALLLTVFALLSDGADENDDVLHYLNARTAWTDRRYLLEIWGRPGYTIPAAAVANVGDKRAGYTATNLLSVAMFLGTAGLVFATARRLRLRYPAAATLAFLLLPTPFALSIMPKTEVAAALYLSAGTALLAGGRRRTAAIVLALLPATRHELSVLLVPIGIYFLLRRDVVAALLLAWAELAWNLASWAADVPIPLTRFLSGAGPGDLGEGDFLHFANRTLELAGMSGAAFALAGVGIVVAALFRGVVRRSGRDDRSAARPGRFPAHPASSSAAAGAKPRGPLATAWHHLMRSGRAARRRRVLLLIAAGAVGVIVLHTLLFAFNRFASGGYPRFLIPIAPWLAVLIALGLTPLLTAAGLRPPHPVPAAPRPPRRPWPLLLAAAVMLATTISPAFLFLLPTTVRVIAAAAVVAFVFRPRQPTARAALFITAACALLHWAQQVGPQRIEPHEICIRDAVARLRAEYPDHLIIGPSPWVEFVQEHPRDTTGPHDPFVYWQKTAADPRDPARPPRLIYVCDGSLAAWIGTPDKVEAVPCRLLFTAKARPEDAGPYVWAYLRLPGVGQR